MDNLAGKAISLASILFAILAIVIFGVLFTAYRDLILIIFLIFIYEVLVSLDLSGTFSDFTKAILTSFGKGSPTTLVSLLPAPRPDKTTQRQLFKLSSPFKTIIVINRGLLYFAFFAILMTSPIASSVFQMPSIVSAFIFYFINHIENILILVFGVFLALVVVDSILDVLEILVD